MKPSKEALEKINEIEKNINEDIKKILIEDAKKLNPYKVGDIIKDHYQIGKIKKICFQCSVFYKEVDVIYECERFTKKLQPFKKNNVTAISLSKVKEKLN